MAVSMPNQPPGQVGYSVNVHIGNQFFGGQGHFAPPGGSGGAPWEERERTPPPVWRGPDAASCLRARPIHPALPMPANDNLQRRRRTWARRERRKRAEKRQREANLGAPEPECVHCGEAGHYVWHCPAGDALFPEGETAAADGSEDSGSVDVKAEPADISSGTESAPSEFEIGLTVLSSDTDSIYEDAHEEWKVEGGELGVGKAGGEVGVLQI